MLRALKPKMEQVALDCWHQGQSVKAILDLLQLQFPGSPPLPANTIYNAVDRARKRGDVRATKRRVLTNYVRGSA